jgi:hypothetical protein
MTRQLLTVLFLSVLLISGVAAQPIDTARVAATLESLRQSVNAHNYDQLEPSLAVDFTYQGREVGISKTIMRQVIAGYPNELSAVTILSVDTTNDAWEVTVRLESAAGMDQRTVRLNKDYRLLQADLADIQLAGHGPQTETPQTGDADLPAATTVGFTLAENLIVVDAEINGISGNYLVDTGAQTIVLNRTRFASDDIETVAMDHAPPSGVGGIMQDVQGVVGLQLRWGAIQIGDLRGLVTDLAHLEKSIGVPIAGIIGFNVLERFQVHFNYAAGELTLYSLDDENRPIVQSDQGDPAQIMQFEMAAHIPVFPVQIAGFELRMGLDSGAGGAMLFERWQATLAGQYDFIERTELRGGDKNVQMGDVVRIDSMQLQDIDYADMTFRFNDIAAHSGNAMPMDGLLGYEFLKTWPTAINFRRRELLIWSESGG